MRIRLILMAHLAFTISIAMAQNEPTYTITGKVVDVDGIPIYSAYVMIDSLRLAVATNKAGEYMIKQVPAGSFSLTVQMVGFHRQVKHVKIQNQSISNVDFKLAILAQTLDAVTVSIETEKGKKENSAEAVEVIEAKERKLKTADLGEVMAQTEGVSVRRTGGLGSEGRFSLNGLTGDQVRFFLDGVPLEYTEYAFGISNVPVNLINRIEVYKGVVPIRFGADALGGAVNLASPNMYYGISGSISYQTGSFGTHRLAAYANYLDESTGIFIRGGVFYDYAQNNYRVYVEVPDEKGRLTEVLLPRFHDAYQAHGVNLSAGIRDKKWADELTIKGFYSAFDKEVQHNNVMSGIPYGDVRKLSVSGGTNLTYRNDFGGKLLVDLQTGYNYTERQFLDTGYCAYNWYGKCILMKKLPGEITGQTGASHQYTWDHSYFIRMNADYLLNENHKIKLSVAPGYNTRLGDELFSGTYDPLTAKGEVLTWVNGLEYQLNAFEGKLENRFFVKHYLQTISSKLDKATAPIVRTEQLQGLGNGIRYTLSERIITKFSYEYATRLPRPDEILGDGQFIINNLKLKPERSHNANLSLSYTNSKNSKVDWSIQALGFVRKIDNLILLIPETDRTNRYENVFEAASTGMELSGNWKSPKNHLQITANTTYQHFYNSSRQGLFESYHRDRIPNTPYLFANANISYAFNKIFNNSGRLELFYNTRYIHAFYRSWESAGLKDFKAEIPSQFSQNAGAIYKMNTGKMDHSIAVETQNLTNARVFDFFGVQKPGRAFYIKLTTQF